MASDSSSSRRDVLKQLAAGTVAASTSATLLSKLWVPSAYAGGPTLSGAGAAPKAYVTFVINVQNFRYLDGSANVVKTLCGIFQKYGVKGDFYLTGNMVQKYRASRNDTIEALKSQGICYHVRPPHPYYNLFDSRYQSVKDSPSTLSSRIEEFESYAQNLSTGELNKDNPGGFKLVKATFGRAPACVAAPQDDATIKEAACAWYRSQGAKGVVWFHGEQPMDNLIKKHDLVVRPCDVVVDSWAVNKSGDGMLWWNRFEKGEPNNEAGYPHKYMQSRVSTFGRGRPPYIVSLIHDDNFQRRGPDAWVNSFWTDTSKSKSKSPPYDLNATDPSSRRSDEEQARILKAYERMVEYCAENYRVVTMNDIANMA